MKSRIREALYIGLFDSLPLLRDPMLLVVISLFSFLPVIFIFVFATAPGAAIQSLIGAIVLTFSFTGLFAQSTKIDPAASLPVSVLCTARKVSSYSDTVFFAASTRSAGNRSFR